MSKTLVLAKSIAKTNVNLNFGLEPDFTSVLSFGLKL